MMLIEDSLHNFSLFSFKSFISPMICIKSLSTIPMEINDRKGKYFSDGRDSIQYVHDIQAMFHSFSKYWSHNKAK